MAKEHTAQTIFERFPNSEPLGVVNCWLKKPMNKEGKLCRFNFFPVAGDTIFETKDPHAHSTMFDNMVGDIAFLQTGDTVTTSVLTLGKVLLKGEPEPIAQLTEEVTQFHREQLQKRKIAFRPEEYLSDRNPIKKSLETIVGHTLNVQDDDYISRTLTKDHAEQLQGVISQLLPYSQPKVWGSIRNPGFFRVSINYYDAMQGLGEAVRQNISCFIHTSPEQGYTIKHPRKADLFLKEILGKDVWDNFNNLLREYEEKIEPSLSSQASSTFLGSLHLPACAKPEDTPSSNQNVSFPEWREQFPSWKEEEQTDTDLSESGDFSGAEATSQRGKHAERIARRRNDSSKGCCTIL